MDGGDVMCFVPWLAVDFYTHMHVLFFPFSSQTTGSVFSVNLRCENAIHRKGSMRQACLPASLPTFLCPRGSDDSYCTDPPDIQK